MNSATLQTKAEQLRDKLYRFWYDQLALEAPDEEKANARVREFIAQWVRNELGISVEAETSPATLELFKLPPHG